MQPAQRLQPEQPHNERVKRTAHGVCRPLNAAMLTIPQSSRACKAGRFPFHPVTPNHMPVPTWHIHKASRKSIDFQRAPQIRRSWYNKNPNGWDGIAPYSSAKYRRLMSFSEPNSKCMGTHFRQSSKRSCGFQVLNASEPNSLICLATDSRKR